MRKYCQYPIVALLCMLSLGVTSCGQDNQVSDPVGDGRVPLYGWQKSAQNPSAENQSYLGWLYQQGTAPSYQYEVALTGVVSVEYGGLIWGHPVTWPEGYDFKYVVAPNSIDLAASGLPANTTHVTITMKVPVLNSVFPCVDAAMPVLLFPDGLRYNSGMPAQLVVSYHPRLAAACDVDSYWFHSSDLDQDSSLFVAEEIYLTGVSNQTFNKNIPPRIKPTPFDKCGQLIPATVEHHSTWSLTKGDDGGDGAPPGWWQLVDPCALP